ncbi:MAG: thioredoxin-dependent thiol peroxidase [Nanoarchaeota archaeon]
MVTIGATAPLFTLKNSATKDINLKNFRGQWVVLYFYPKDMTPGCTIEANEFSHLKKEFEKKDATIIGISKDTCESHKKFIEKERLTIQLLSDPDTKVMKLYGVWKKKKFMGREFLGTVRSTCLIDPKGKIAKTWQNVTAKGHAAEVLHSIR